MEYVQILSRFQHWQGWGPNTHVDTQAKPRYCPDIGLDRWNDLGVCQVIKS